MKLCASQRQLDEGRQVEWVFESRSWVDGTVQVVWHMACEASELAVCGEHRHYD